MRRAWVAIQRNRTSGTGRSRQAVLDLVSRLRFHGLTPRLYSCRERMSRALDVPASRDNLVGIVAAGGDGTVRDIIDRFPGIPIAVLPLGTENLLARYLQIPRCGRTVADMIAAGQTRRLDLATAGERRFTLMASLGIDAAIVHLVHARRVGNISRLNYIQPILQSLRSYQYSPLRVFLDDDPHPILARTAIVTNLPAYALGLKIAETARGDDGLLDLRLFERGSPYQILRYFFRVATGTHERLADVTCCRASRIRVESEEPVPVQADGDPAGWTPIDIRCVPSALEVFIPSTNSSATRDKETPCLQIP